MTIAADTSSARRPVPRGCLGPLACSRLGICGRDACIADEERDRFAGELQKALSPANPHRPPDVNPVARHIA